MPILFCLLVAWYFVYRLGGAATARVARAAAHAADRVADTAGRLGPRADRLHAQASGAAERLRAQADAAARPRTRAGQRFAETRTAGPTPPAGAGPAGSTGPGWAGSAVYGLLGGLWGWVRRAWVDAVAAAESAQARRATDQPAWWRWPSGDDPQAPLPPVRATAHRLDEQAPHPDLPGAPALPAPTPVPVPGPTPPPLPAGTAPHPDLPGLPPTAYRPAVAPPRPALTTRNTTGKEIEMSVATTTGGAPVAESGLSAYESYAQTMAGQCGHAVSAVEASAAECGDAISSADLTHGALLREGWSGVPVDALASAREALSTAQQAFATAQQALATAQSYYQQMADSVAAARQVTEAYAAQAQAGEKESVLN